MPYASCTPSVRSTRHARALHAASSPSQPSPRCTRPRTCCRRRARDVITALLRQSTTDVTAVQLVTSSRDTLRHRCMSHSGVAQRHAVCNFVDVWRQELCQVLDLPRTLFGSSLKNTGTETKFHLTSILPLF